MPIVSPPPGPFHAASCAKAMNHALICSCGLVPFPEKTAKEQVDHPDHYGGKDNPYEAIKIIEALKLDFHVGNAFKYMARAGKKDKPGASAREAGIEDLQKAVWYLQRAIEYQQSNR